MSADPSSSNDRDGHAPHDGLVVGIGGSAGSIHSFREFLRNVPPDSGNAYVVILHLSPEHESRLAEVLQGAASIPVHQVTEAVRVEANHVYVIPPNKSLSMRDGTLVVSDISSYEQRRAPIDIFFRTLADGVDSRAVAVVMSGSGADGSMGLRRVKEYNGLVLVQDPSESSFAEMPRNSIATGLVDFVVPVSEMPRRIMTYRDQLRAVRIPGPEEQPSPDAMQDLSDVLTVLRARTGHDFSNYKRATVARRIERRLAVHGIPSLGEYATFIREHTREPHALVTELLISVTNFFRDREVWERLEMMVLPELVSSRAAGQPLRMWVAGCATGEEAYSLAMLVAEQSPAGRVQIFATDLDANAISRARLGFYNEADTADVSPERLRRFFIREQDGYRVRREVREMVLFAHHDLLKSPPFSHLDFVSCRNLLIYLNREAQRRALDVFHFSLEPGRLLLLGTAESCDTASHLFALVDRETHVYQSRAVARTLHAPALFPADASKVVPPASGPGENRPAPRLQMLSPADLHQRLLEQYAPPSVIVDEQYQILHLSATAGKYLQFHGGEASTNLLDLVRQELRSDLRGALFQAEQKRIAVTAPDLLVHVGERAESINLVIRPSLQDGDPVGGFFLILFEPASGPEAGASPAIPLRHGAPQLEEELFRARANLRASTEQYEVQVEEAKAANEELQAMNQELLSTTQELESSQEELQSVNEELQSVNQELKNKIDEITHTSDDLRNLISSTDIGTIFVDLSLRVKLFTPRVRDIFNLISSDAGRPLLDIASKLVDHDLSPDIRHVIEHLGAVEREVETRGGFWFLMRILPYRTSADRVEGLVLTFVDITTRKRSEQALRESHALLERSAALAAYRVALTDALRTLTDAGAIQTTAARVIGEHLRADRAFYVEIDRENGQFIVTRSYADATLPSIAGRHSLSPLGPSLLREIEDGRTAVRDDVDAAKDLSPAERAAYAALSIGSLIAFPFRKFGKLVNVFMVTSSAARSWSEWDIALVGETAERTWDAVERSRAESALRKSEQRHRMIVEGALDYAILTTDREGTIESWSPGAEAIFGWTAEEMIGQPIANTFTPEDRVRGIPELEREAATNHSVAPDVRWHVCKNGSRVFIDGVIRALEHVDGGVREFLKIGQDVTKRRETEKALLDSEAALRTERDLLETRVGERTRDLEELGLIRQQLLERLVASVEDERHRIARELHDEMGQHITSLKIGLEGLPAEPGIERMKETVRQIDQSIDRLTLELRPPVLDDQGLQGAIASLVEQFAAFSGIETHVHTNESSGERLNSAIETTLYRVLQEALTNVWKHATAHSVSVILERQPGQIQLIVEDDGRGFETGDTGEGGAARFGLLGIRERVSMIGGTFNIESGPGRGTTLYVRVPLLEP